MICTFDAWDKTGQTGNVAPVIMWAGVGEWVWPGIWNAGQVRLTMRVLTGTTRVFGCSGAEGCTYSGFSS